MERLRARVPKVEFGWRSGGLTQVGDWVSETYLARVFLYVVMVACVTFRSATVTSKDSFQVGLGNQKETKDHFRGKCVPRLLPKQMA